MPLNPTTDNAPEDSSPDYRHWHSRQGLEHVFEYEFAVLDTAMLCNFMFPCKTGSLMRRAPATFDLRLTFVASSGPGGANLGLAFPYPRALSAPAEGSSPLRTARPVQVDMYVCVCGWVRGLDRLRVRPFCLLRPSAPALACRGFITGAGGLPRQWYVHCVAPCRARGGCRALVSVSGASVAIRAV